MVSSAALQGLTEDWVDQLSKKSTQEVKIIKKLWEGINASGGVCLKMYDGSNALKKYTYFSKVFFL